MRIEAKVVNQKIEISRNYIAERSRNYLHVDFDFTTEDWDGTIKTAYFENAKTQVTKDQILENNSCVVPWEVLVGAGMISLSVEGIKDDGYNITTGTEKFLLNAMIYGGDSQKPPTPTVYEQLVNMSQETKEIAQSVRDDADNGEFDGKPGETPVRGEDYWTEEDKEEIIREASEDVISKVNGIATYLCEPGEYDENGTPTVLNPKENTIYLVPTNDINNMFAQWQYIKQLELFDPFGYAAVDLTNYIKNTDYATATKAGIVKPIYDKGITIDANGCLGIVSASYNNIINKFAQKAITPNNLDWAVKFGITANTEILTTEEKQAAKDWLGVNDIKTIKPDAEGNYSCRIIDMEAGIYYLPTGTVVGYGTQAQTSNRETITGDSWMLVSVPSNSEENYGRKYFHIFGLGGFAWYCYGNVTTLGGSINKIIMNALMSASSNSNITGAKTFTAQPLITSPQEDYTESSDKIPTMRWVQEAVKAAIDALPKAEEVSV